MLFVVPDYRPKECGVSDHTDIIATAIRNSGETVRIIVGPDAAKSEITNAGSNEVVFIQAVLYGYHRYGLIAPLIKLAIKAKNCGLRVATFFHELPSQFMPLRRSSVLVLPQNFLCQSLAKHSDFVFVNQARGLQILRDAGGREPVYIPTWSNIKEADVDFDIHLRPNQIVVFGTPVKRERIYRKMLELGGPDVLFGRGFIITDIGNPFKFEVPSSWSIQRLGLVDGAVVGNALTAARFGLFTAPTGETSKSSVFASYCAYGVVPVNVEQQNFCFPQDPRPGLEFIELSKMVMDVDSQQTIQNGARAWHARNSVPKSIKCLLAAIT